jgi:hypothetical protein
MGARTPGFSVTKPGVRAVLVTGFAALLLALPAAAADWSPSATWLLQARCVHLKEGAWTANTGNGYYGGMQFARATWRHVGGKPDPAFTHPGNRAYPFSATSAEQLYRAWVLWQRDGGTWHSWGAVGASCS